MYAIEFENVSFSYSGTDVNDNLTKTEEVLSDFRMKVEKGAFVALLGRNGSGKSTCAKLINGLLVPTSGKVTVLGMDTQDKKSLFEIRKKAGMVFQNPDNQQVASIVEDDVAFGPENIGMPREEMKKRIDYALKVTGTEEFRKAQASRLSGGQKQRVAIAGAIAINPEILILDESTSMLDPKGRREVMSVIRTLNREEGMTVIDITHYMDEAAEADAIYVLNEGKIAKTGTPEEVFSDAETLERCGLELPRAALIAKKLKEGGLPIDGVNLDKGGLSEKLCELFRKV